VVEVCALAAERRRNPKLDELLILPGPVAGADALRTMIVASRMVREAASNPTHPSS
jgi:hypothetical protein